MPGIIDGVHDALRETLADCYAWQNWQGNSFTRAQALARIYQHALPKPASGGATHTLAELQALRPFMLIYTEPEGGFVMTRDADGLGYDQRGRMIVMIEQDIPEDSLDDPSAIDADLYSDLGTLIRSQNTNQPGLAELADVAGNFICRRVETMGPVRTEEEDVHELGEAQRVWLLIDWGFNV